ncbi:hypothetical protein D2Q93_13045 [Alicyclobacillaceae bacterium I2511]|nr:hypothetical protein D2Q93_13045 [Alicyclobacillaceae bacterium I2511]
MFLELPGGVNHPPSAKGRKRRVAASVERVSCTVDHESDMLIGDGLGSALLRHLKDSPVAGVHDWVIETA